MNKFGSYENIPADESFDSSKPYSHKVSVFRSDCSNDWLYVPRWHEQFELKLILSGTAEVFCGTELYVVKAGDVVIINPYEMHGLRPHGNEELRYYCLMLSPDFPFPSALGECYTELFEGKYSFSKILSDCTEVNRVFSDLFAELNSNRQNNELQVEAYISLLFSLLLRNAVSDEKASVDTPNFKQNGERIRPALNYIYFHYTESISIPELAELCSMSLYHFCRIFKTVIGCTAVAYINTIRLNKAALLLTTTNMPINEISGVVGFPDELYFSRRFKQEKGMSPTGYRTNSHL